MIEKIIYDYLKDALDVPVYFELPEKKNVPFVVVEKTGSARDNYILEATIAIQSYADTLFNAAALNETVKDAILSGLYEQEEIGHVGLNSDYNFTDTALKTYRYQAVFNINYYSE